MSKGVIVLVFAIVFNAVANILIKVGMLRVGKTESLVQTLTKAVTQPAILLGVVSFGLALGAYGFVLTKLNLSVAYPTMVSMGLIIVVLASYFFLNEVIRPVQIAGFVLIIAGVWMVAR